MPTGDRIAKVIAHSGHCSRRDAEKLIEAGKVKLNGKVISSPAINVTDSDKIEVEGKLLQKSEQTRLWLYHKPKGLITSHKDPQGRKTVFESLPKSLPRVISVGRLDLNTEGLLLLTNDGELSRKLELPSTGLKREYRCRVHGKITPDMIKKLKAGIKTYGPIDVKIEVEKESNTWALVTLSEGKNREIRNAFEHFGLKVSRLIRISYGPFKLGELKPSEIKEIPYNRVKKLVN